MEKAEKHVVKTLIEQGNSVQVIPRTKEALFQGQFLNSADFLVNGTEIIELKSLKNAFRLPRITRKATTQAFASPSIYSKKVIIDMMNSPNSFLEIQQKLYSCFTPLVDVEVWTREGIVTLRKGQLNLPLKTITAEGMMLISNQPSTFFPPNLVTSWKNKSDKNSSREDSTSEGITLKSYLPLDTDPSKENGDKKKSTITGKINSSDTQQSSKNDMLASTFLPTHTLPLFNEFDFDSPKMDLTFDTSKLDFIPSPLLLSTTLLNPFHNRTKQLLWSSCFDPLFANTALTSFFSSKNAKESASHSSAQQPLTSVANPTTSFQTVSEIKTEYSIFLYPSFPSIYNPLHLSTGMSHPLLVKPNHSMLLTPRYFFNLFNQFRRYCGGFERRTGIIGTWNEVVNLTEIDFILEYIKRESSTVKIDIDEEVEFNEDSVPIKEEEKIQSTSSSNDTEQEKSESDDWWVKRVVDSKIMNEKDAKELHERLKRNNKKGFS